MHDETGNSRTLTVASATLNVVGKYGSAIQFAGTSASRLTSSAAFTAAVDMRSYAIGAWVKVNVNPALQVRLFNVSDSSEYSVLEIRNGDEISMFTREQAQDQNVYLADATDETWVHIIQFNDEAAGKCGMYLGTTLHEFDKTLPGLTGGVCDATRPDMFFWLDGAAQHIFLLDGKPTQEQVNTLLA